MRNSMRIVLSHQKAKLKHASNGTMTCTVTTTMAKHASSASLSPSSAPTDASQTSTFTIKQHQQHQQQQQETPSSSKNVSAASTSTLTTTNGAITKLSTTFCKLYRNNPHQVIPIEIISSSSSSSSSSTNTSISNNSAILRKRRMYEQLIQVAIMLCPELILSTLPKLHNNNNDDDSSSSCCCYYWRFASPLKQIDDNEHLKNENNDDKMFIEVWSSSSSSCVSSSETLTTAIFPLHIRPLMGGLSNQLYIVENPYTNSSTTTRGAPVGSVLVRIFPSCAADDYDDVVDREYENKLLAWLSRRHDADDPMIVLPVPVPMFYGRFLNGRVEEFYHNVQTLTCHEMSQHLKDTARLLARLHCTTLHQQQHTLATVDENDDNDTDACPLLYKSLVLQYGIDAYPGDIVPRINAWFHRLDNVLVPKKALSSISSLPGSTISVNTMIQNDETNSLLAIVCLLKEEWQWLQSKLFFYRDNSNNSSTNRPTTLTATAAAAAARDFCRQVVLTHMDAQSLNLLVQTAAGDSDHTSNNNGHRQGKQNSNNNNNSTHDDVVNMKLIDFEYAGFNPRAADIANTFCEHCDMNNLRGKWQDEYPTLQQQEYFLRAYLDELITLSSLSSSSSTTTASLTSSSLSENGSILQQYYNRSSSDKDKKEFLMALCHEIGRYTLLSHLSWAVWSCVQHVNRYSTSNSGSNSTRNAAASSSNCNCNNNNNDDDDDDDFNYLLYARHRIDGYRYFQEMFMSNSARI